MNVTEQMIRDFNAMVKDRKKYPGQNWLAVIYRNAGNGIEHAPDGRLDVPCVCWDKDKHGKEYTFRTMLEDEIRRGDIVYIPEQDRYYLLEKLTRRDPQCWSTIATPCNMRITISCPVPDEVDEEGHILSRGYKQVYINALPCVRRPSIRYTGGSQGTPGSVSGDDAEISLQHNSETEKIALEDEFFASLHTYTIYDKITDGGILKLYARAKAGEMEKR